MKLAGASPAARLPRPLQRRGLRSRACLRVPTHADAAPRMTAACCSALDRRSQFCTCSRCAASSADDDVCTSTSCGRSAAGGPGQLTASAERGELCAFGRGTRWAADRWARPAAGHCVAVCEHCSSRSGACAWRGAASRARRRRSCGAADGVVRAFACDSVLLLALTSHRCRPGLQVP